MLSHKNPKTRVKGINSLLQFEDKSKILALIGDCAQDSDHRVRIAALKAYFTLHNENQSFSCDPFYQHAVSLLSDDFIDVRIEALKFFWLLTKIFPNKSISINNSQPIILIDYAFKKICSCVTDISPLVRTTACRLLGSLRNIKEDLILQTMSKTVLNDDIESKAGDLDKQTSMNEFFGKNETVGENESDGNHIITDDTLQIRDQHLIDSAAAGAFIHGLEDEFLEVRSAAIDAICELCQSSDKLAVISTGPIVDMLNDEIHSIRDNSIHSLSKMGKKIIFNEEEFEIVLATSEDKEESTRSAIYKLLRSTKLATVWALKRSIEVLSQNLKKYPDDIDMIFACLKSLGEQYSSFTENIVYELLQLDTRFLPREANVNDSEYIGKMIVILNAIVKNRKIISMLPPYAKSHYIYMRDKWPDYTPRLDYYVIKLQDFPVSFNFDKNLATASFGEMKLLASIEMLLQSNKKNEALKLLKQCQESFLRIHMLDKSLAARSEYFLKYLRCLKIIMKVNPLAVSHPSFVLFASKLMQLTYEIENRYLGLSISSILHFNLLRLYSHAMILVYQLRLHLLFGTMRNLQSNEFSLRPLDLSQTIKRFQSRIETVEKKFLNFKIDPPPVIAHWKKVMAFSNIEDVIFSSFSKDLLEYKLGSLKEEREERMIKKASAEITHPKTNIDDPIIFLYSFPIQIEVEGIVFSVPNAKRIMVRVLFPDNTVQFFCIPPSTIKPIKPFSIQIKTSILIRQNIWTEKSELLISFIMMIESDIPWFDTCIANANSQNTKQELIENVDWIEISQPLKYFIFPKDERGS